MPKLADVLDTPEIRRRTQRVLDLKEKSRQTQRQLSAIYADIGDELVAVKAALDKTPDKAAWLRWLEDHVRFERTSAEGMMTLARMRKKFPDAWEKFSGLAPTSLTLIAALPPDIMHGLDPKSRLKVAPNGPRKAIEDMSSRELRHALDLLLGRGEKPSQAPAPDDDSRDARGQRMLRKGRAFLKELLSVNAGQGKLQAATKEAMMDLEYDWREAILHWKAWVTPKKRRR